MAEIGPITVAVNIGRCRDCRHYVSIDHGMDTRRECRSDKICEPLDEDRDASDQLVYEYDESGWFFPGPDFGCVHWEERNGDA